MKRYSLFLILFLSVFVFSFLLPNKEAKGQGTDYVAEAVAALQTSNVYVAPGTPNTNLNTVSELSGYLTHNDSVVLVMLPEVAAKGTDIPTIAKKISEGISNYKTVGLAVGNLVVGYSAILPTGVASDQMIRANSVSNSPITALETFARNIQIWLDQNPQPTPTPSPEPTPTPRPTMEPIELPDVSEIPLPIRAIPLIIFLVAVVLLANPIVKSAKRNKRKNHLESMRPTIKEIQVNVTNIEEAKVRKDLDGACKAATGLLNSFLRTNVPAGDPEKYFPMLLAIMDMQVSALIDHESGLRPLDTEQLSQLKYLLLNYDSLFVRLQQNDPQAVKLMTSMIEANKIMTESLGYQTN